MDIVGDLGKLMDQEILANPNQYDDDMSNQLFQLESLSSKVDYSSLSIERSCKIY